MKRPTLALGPIFLAGLLIGLSLGLALLWLLGDGSPRVAALVLLTGIVGVAAAIAVLLDVRR